jgi:predicted amidohydrolase
MKWSVALVQFTTLQGDPDQNLERAEAYIRDAAKARCELVCFPEMWTTGFDWKKNRELAVGHDRIVNRIADMAERYRIRIAGSMLCRGQDDKLYNRFLWLGPRGERFEYDKVHLFSLFREEDHMEPGTHADAIMLANGQKVAFAVCYDLRFPELFRKYAVQCAELVILVAAFPHPRLLHWQTLIRARAIENMFFLVAVNRSGEEIVNGNVVRYCGSSAVYGPNGEAIAEIEEDGESMVIARFDTEESKIARCRMPVLYDRRPEIY